MRWTTARHQPWLHLVVTLVAALAGAWAISLAISLPAEDGFNVVDWELRHAPNKGLYLAGRMLRGGLSPEEEDERLGRFLLLTAQAEAALSDADEAQRERVAGLLRERDGLENDVEAIVEGRLAVVLEEAGLDSSLPLFPDARWVFPPVDVEFDEPPRELAVSPRERIVLVERRPLRPGLSLEEAIEIEQAEERDGRRSALVLRLSGVATYPSIVAAEADYGALVAAVAHEWVHHYLFFKPLGRRYAASLELRTLNETVADLAGHELAQLVVRRYPLAPEAAAELAALRPEAPAVDVDAVLRQLRLDVEALLARGEIEGAEALMERRRRELAERGATFRRINQAFFAFRGVYADDPASIDPAGGKLEALRQQAGSAGAFLRAAATLTSAGDLDRLLASGR